MPTSLAADPVSALARPSMPQGAEPWGGPGEAAASAIEAGAGEPTDTFLDRELRRGTLVLAVLSSLRSPTGIYELHRAMAKGALGVRQSTLYLMVKRLSDQGLVVHSLAPGGGGKKLHRLTPAGSAALSHGMDTWRKLASALEPYLGAA